MEEQLKKLIKGNVIADPSAMSDFASDFGRIVKKTPRVVLQPADTDDIVHVVQFANQEGLPVATRGRAHSQSGQSLTDGGILLDMSALVTIEEIDTEGSVVTCQAGIRWEDLMLQLALHNLTPPVLTNNLDVIVGGTLSTAGLGISSFQYGTQADNVEALEVVLGTGEMVTCSPGQNKEVFDAVRAGLGQFGVITKATLKLVPHKPSVRTYYLLYDDLGAILNDAQILINEGRFDYLESWCSPCTQGFRETEQGRQPFAEWLFPLHASIQFDPTSLPSEKDLLGGLQFYRHVHTENSTYLEFCRRLESLFDLWKKAGYWASAHPWMETMLPFESAESYISTVLENLSPVFLGGGHVLLWYAQGETSNVPLFLTPAEQGTIVGFGILPGIPPEMVEVALALVDRASDFSMQVGGKRYLSGWIAFDEEKWQAHYGEMWPTVCNLKRSLDPMGTLNPGFIPYPTP